MDISWIGETVGILLALILVLASQMVHLRKFLQRLIEVARPSDLKTEIQDVVECVAIVFALATGDARA